MRVIISPAKKMNNSSDMEYMSLPIFQKEAADIFETLKKKSYDELKALWKCSDRLTRENMEHLARTEVVKNRMPALLAYEGIQYQYMKPSIFTNEEWAYVQEHVRIISGIYGVLKPLDGIVPYRLEMQAKLALGETQDLYGFWGTRLHDSIYSETDVVIDLASDEYSRCIRQGKTEEQRYVQCVFAVQEDDKLKVKGTWAKMARGEMVRYMAVHGVQSLEELKDFSGLGYVYNEQASDFEHLVFIKDVALC